MQTRKVSLILTSHTTILIQLSDDEPSSLPSTREPDHIASPIESDPEDDSSDADVSPSVNYSLGEDGDALADSLARALRSTQSDFEDEIPLPDEQYGEEEDPFFCGQL